jgi:phosphoenolpyruvate synthase/pyruvate phosphate dikinase
MNTDIAWKIGTVVLSVIVVPTFIWVWNTHSAVQAIQIENMHRKEKHEQFEKKLETLEQNTIDIALVQRDLTHLNTKIDELHTILIRIDQKD